MRIYTTEDRHELDPGPCPKCGDTNARVNWVDVHTSDEMPGSSWVPGTVTCLNQGCPSNTFPQAGALCSKWGPEAQ